MYIYRQGEKDGYPNVVRNKREENIKVQYLFSFFFPLNNIRIY